MRRTKPRDDDPFEQRRQELEDQARKLSEEMEALKSSLEQSNVPIPAELNDEPAVWAIEEEEDFSRPSGRRPAGPSPRRLRTHRRRERMKFFIILAVFAIIMLLISRTFWP